MANAIELETYRYIVKEMLEKAGYVIKSDEAAEDLIRAYRVGRHSCRTCSEAIIRNEA